MAHDIPSPCVRNCCLDLEDVCMGCFRHVDEITAWGGSNHQQKQQILENARHRREKAEKQQNL